jgi:hypothetical protein
VILAASNAVTVRQLPKYLKRHWPKIREQLLAGTYQPQPVKRVEISKPDGGVRKLGVVPTENFVHLCSQGVTSFENWVSQDYDRRFLRIARK